MIFGIEHLVGAGKAVIAQSGGMHIANCENSLKHIGFFVGVGLMEHSLISLTGSSRLVGINSRDNDNFILNLILNASKAGNVIEHRLVIIRRTGSDYKQKLIALTLENRLNLLVAQSLGFGHFFC